MKEELKNTDAHEEDIVPEKYNEIEDLLRQVTEKTKECHNEGLKIGVFNVAYLRHESGALTVNIKTGYSSTKDMCISIVRALADSMKENPFFIHTLFALLTEQLGQDFAQGILDAMKRLNVKKDNMLS